jgi:hypothetical protein
MRAGGFRDERTAVLAKPICRVVGAICWEGDLPDERRQHLNDNAAFASQALPGRDGP